MANEDSDSDKSEFVNHEGKNISDCLQGQIYVVCNSRNKSTKSKGMYNSCIDVPSIVYCGETGTKRYKLLKELFKEELCSDPEPPQLCHTESTGKSSKISHVGIGNLLVLEKNERNTKKESSLSQYSFTFSVLLDAFKSILLSKPLFFQKIYTSLKLNNVIYRADPCSNHCFLDTVCGMKTGAWNDWALLRNPNGDTHSPYAAQIFGFTCMSPEDIKEWNQSLNTIIPDHYIVESISPVIVAIIQRSRNPLFGFLDPSKNPRVPDPEDESHSTGQAMQSNSIFLFLERKEF